MAKKQVVEKVKETENLVKLMDELNSKYGEGTVIGGKDIVSEKEVISTGSLTLDIATNIGGLPLGKLIEMFGPESSGKSTMALHYIAEFQKAGKKCALCDSEQSFDRTYATNLGVDVDKLLYVQPECQEDGYNIIEKLVRSKEIGLIVIDSHTSMLPRKVVDGEVGEATIGLQARVNSIAIGKIHPLLGANKCTIVAISQTRTNIGGYGDPNIATGGLAYKFYSDMRLKTSKVLDREKDQNKTTVEVVKNKCGTPFGKAEFKIVWGKGIDRDQEIIDLAVEYKIIKQAGAWITLEDGETKCQGGNGLKELFESNPEYKSQLVEKVMEKIKTE